MRRRVVVTGLGAVTPVGNDVATTWRALLASTSGAGPITKFDTTHFKVRFACEVKGFDPLAYMERKEVKRNDLYTQYALAASVQAMHDAGLADGGGGVAGEVEGARRGGEVIHVEGGGAQARCAGRHGDVAEAVPARQAGGEVAIDHGGLGRVGDEGAQQQGGGEGKYALHGVSLEVGGQGATMMSRPASTLLAATPFSSTRGRATALPALPSASICTLVPAAVLTSLR